METDVTVNAILACDTKYGIGKNGGLPWQHNEADMLWFRNNTRDGVVVMGSNTWKSIGEKKLKNRINIIVSRSSRLEGEFDGVFSGALSDITNSLKKIYPDKKIWIIGGGEIYRQGIPICNNIYLTKFKKEYDCDTFIDPKLLTDFVKLAHSEKTDDCSFTIWSRL